MSFVNTIWPDDPIATLALLIFAAALLAGASILTLRGNNRRRLALRFVLNAMSVVCLFLFILPPAWKAQIETGAAILITTGVKMDRVKTFVDTSEVKRAFFTADAGIDWASRFPGATEIPDLAFLQRNHPEIGALHVFGFGLPKYDWERHPSLRVFHHEPDFEEGITSASWAKELRLGQLLRVNGTLLGMKGREGVLRLIGPGGVADSVAVSSASDTRFRLQTTPRDIGRYVYTIDFSVDGKTHFEEPVAVSVSAPRPLRLLVLEHAPSFQSKYLKRWLAENGAALALRSQISQDRYRTEFLNMPEMALGRISRRLLGGFDLVIIDGKTLNRLTRRERTILQTAVAEDGLGVFLVADQTLVDGDDQSGQPFHRLRFIEFSDLEYRLVKLKLGSLRDRETTPIRVAPFEIQYEPGLKPQIKDNTGRIMAAAFTRGRGRIGTSLVRGPYQWILQDRPDYHAAYWSYLISELARPAQSEAVWRAKQNRLAFIDQPVDFQLFATEAEEGRVTTPNGEIHRVHPRQEVLFPGRWSATYWPRESGWHRVSTATGVGRWFYVHGSQEWQLWQANDSWQATRRIANSAPSKLNSLHRRAAEQVVPVGWIFVLFLLSTSLLWIEKKL